MESLEKTFGNLSAGANEVSLARREGTHFDVGGSSSGVPSQSGREARLAPTQPNADTRERGPSSHNKQERKSM